jgi:peptidoglycan/LPS O-acetylase OafA/YrhL
MRLLAAQEYSHFNFWHHIAPTHLRMDSLALGVALAYAVQFHIAFIEKLRTWRRALLLAGMACYLPALLAAQATPFIFTCGLTLQGLGATGIVLWAWFASTGGKAAHLTPSAACSQALPVRALAFVGTFSYSIYLWHRPVAHSLAIKIKSLLHIHAHAYDFMVLMGIYLVVSLVLGVVTYALIEGPALRLRNRLFPDASPERSAGSPVPGVWELAAAPSAQK